MPKTSEKRFYKNIRVVLCKKTVRKNNYYSRIESNFKIRQLKKGSSPCKRYSLCKLVSFSQEVKMPKHAKNDFSRTCVLLCGKSHSKKHQIIEKWDHFENQPFCKGYSPCISYSLCLGQKLKIPKTFKKRFYKNIWVILCKKPLEKTTNILELRPI